MYRTAIHRKHPAFDHSSISLPITVGLNCNVLAVPICMLDNQGTHRLNRDVPNDAVLISR